MVIQASELKSQLKSDYPIHHYTVVIKRGTPHRRLHSQASVLICLGAGCRWCLEDAKFAALLLNSRVGLSGYSERQQNYLIVGVLQCEHGPACVPFMIRDDASVAGCSRDNT